MEVTVELITIVSVGIGAAVVVAAWAYYFGRRAATELRLGADETIEVFRVPGGRGMARKVQIPETTGEVRP